MRNLTTKQGKPMDRFLITPLLVLMCLSLGCASLNNNFNSYTFPPTAPVSQTNTTTPDPIKTSGVMVDDKDEDYKCRPFRYEFSGTGPELPDAKILEAGDDIKKVEAIERQHIKELRAHLAKMRRRLRDAMLEHEMECRKAAGP